MSEYLLFQDFLDFKKRISIRYLSEKDTRKDWYTVILSVEARVSQYYLLRTILELIMFGYNRQVITDILHLTGKTYISLLYKLKRIVGMPGKPLAALRKNQGLIERRFNEYYDGLDGNKQA